MARHFRTLTNAEKVEEILFEREETKATFLPRSCWLDAFSDSTIISARAARWKVNSCGLGSAYIYTTRYSISRAYTIQREREREREIKGEGEKRRWCVKLTARLPVSRDYCSNSRARRVTVRTLGRYSLIHKRPRSLVSGFVREIVACYIPWLYIRFLQVAPRGNSPTIFSSCKRREDAPLLSQASAEPSSIGIPLWKLTAALYRANSLFPYLRILPFQEISKRRV